MLETVYNMLSLANEFWIWIQYAQKVLNTLSLFCSLSPQGGKDPLILTPATVKTNTTTVATVYATR